ncbi:MAG: amidohydrolase family protein [Dehalococcoidia bacterium]
MDVVIGNALVITVDGDRRIITDGAIAVLGDRIAAVGPTREVRAAHPTLPAIDARGKAVIPGFINTHTHAVLMVLRGTVEDMGGEAVYNYMSPITFAMNGEERSALAALSCLEAIRSGTTTLVDPLRHVTTYARAMADSGLRLFLSESCADALTLEVRNGVYTYDRQWGQDFLDRAEALVEEFHGADGGRVQVQIAAHAPDNCSPWMLDSLREMAERHGLRRTVHLAQSRGEFDQVAALHGRTPAQYLDDHGWLAPDVIGAHWTFCTDDDIRLLAERGVHMAHCPASGSRRRPQPSPVGRIRDAGINMTLGTDNMSENMFEALNIGISLHRGAYGGGAKPTPGDMLDAATRNGAAAVGRTADLGSIEAGKKADLAILNINHPSLRPISSVVSNLVHYGHPGVVDSVMVDGRFVMQDGRVTSMDEEAVVTAGQRAMESAWRRLGERWPDIAPRPDVTPGV